MAKEEFVRSRRPANMGTIGSMDHGKMVLSAAIMRHFGEVRAFEDINNAPKEEARGIRIEVVHVEYESESRHYGPRG